MLYQFFCQGTLSDIAKAWGGLTLVVLHGLFRAWVKWRLNDWYSRFYDLGGTAAEYGSGDTDELTEGRERVLNLLVEFTAVVMPTILIHPLFKWITNLWVLKWRVTLVRAYLRCWRTDVRIENGAQRVHEDTSRFARGLLSCCIVVLDAFLTLAVFAPVLIALGADVQPMAGLPDSWLLLVCGCVALVGVCGSVLLGWSLIALEVCNQKVEADLRRKLVLLEEDPTTVTESSPTPHADSPDEYIDNVERVSRSNDRKRPIRANGGARGHQRARTDTTPSMIASHFHAVLRALRKNYSRLYRRFAVFSLWLGAYEQTVAILPYVIAAPLLFSASDERRITLGKVTQLANAFGHVFDALNILSDRWVDVTDWLSVLRRLREWERHLSNEPRSPVVACALIETGAARSTDDTTPPRPAPPTPHCTATLSPAAAVIAAVKSNSL